MADNVTLPGSGALVATDEVTDGTLGTVQVQYLKLMDGTLDGTNKATVTSGGALKVDGSGATQPVSIAAAITANQGSPPWTMKPDGTVWTLTSTSANVNVTNSTITVAQSGTNWGVNSATNPTVSMNSTTANTGVTSALAAGFDDSSPTSITENNFGFLRMSANRNLYGTIRDAAGNERGVNVTTGNALTVDASATTQPVSIAAAVTVQQSTASSLNATVTGTVTANAQSSTAPISTMNSASAASGVNSAAAYVFDDVSPTSITENNFGFARMSANRNQYMTIRDAAGNERGVNVTTGNALTVDATATTQPVSIAATVSVGGATSNASDAVATGSVSVPTIGYNYVFGGTTWDRARSAAVGDGAAATGIAAAGGMFYNGSTWDRVRGSSINGLYVCSGTLPISSMNSASASAGVNAAMAAVFDDVSPTSITENSFGFVRMSANRNQYTTIRDAAGNERGVNVSTGNALLVDATATTQPVSIAATVSVGGSTSNASDTVATGSVSVPTVAYNYGFNGTQWDRLQVDANKFLKVVGVGTYSTAADGVSTITNGLGCNGYSYVFNGTTWDRLRGDTTNGVFANVRGNVASGSADSGNPVKIGGVAATSNPTAVTNGQRVNAMYDKLGKQVTVGALREQKSDQLATLSNTTETTIVTAGGAGVFNDLYALIITNKSATTVFVDIRDTTGGTLMMTLAAPANDTRGWTVPVDSAMAQTTANTNWTAQLSGAVSSVVITALFVKNA